MPDPVKATQSFAYPAGATMRVMKAGKVLPGDDPVVARYPQHFRPAFEDTTSADRGGARVLPAASQQARQAARDAASDAGDERVRHVGGGTYELPNGERVRGREAAEARLAEIDEASGPAATDVPGAPGDGEASDD